MTDSPSTYSFLDNPQGKYRASGGSNPVNSDTSPYLDDQYPDSLGADLLSIALIGPDEGRRKAAATALAGCQGGEIREFSSYPPSLDDVPKLLEQHYDVIIIDLDSHPEYALELVESICANGASTVMVYSAEGRLRAAGALHAGRSARVSHLAVYSQHDGRSAGAGLGAPAGDTPAEEGRRAAAGVFGRQGRRRRNHAGLQLCRLTGPGVEPKHAA